MDNKKLKTNNGGRKKVIIGIVILSFILLAFLGYLIWENNTFGVTYYTQEEPGLNGLKILQISDLHNKNFGNSNKKLVDTIENIKPDYIVLTGDIIESPKLTIAKELLAACVTIAPTYYVSGNHEGDCGQGVFEDFKNYCKDIGINFIDNKRVTVQYNAKEVTFVGMGDVNLYATGDKKEYILNTLNSLKSDDTYNILLSHRPDFFEEYVKADYDFVFTGHAHGGQWRLGKLGAYSPSQGLFPKYSAGLYTQGNTTMLVNRGLGNSAKGVPRIFNRPEITVVEFK